MRRTLHLTAVIGLGFILPPTPSLAGEACEQSVETCVRETYEWFHHRGWVGVELESQETGRYRVSRVIEGSPAAAAGLEIGDELAALDGIPYGEKSEAERLKAHYRNVIKPGNKVTYTVLRGATSRDVEITLGAVPKEVVECWLGRHLLQSHLADLAEREASPSP